MVLVMTADGFSQGSRWFLSGQQMVLGRAADGFSQGSRCVYSGMQVHTTNVISMRSLGVIVTEYKQD